MIKYELQIKPERGSSKHSFPAITFISFLVRVLLPYSQMLGFLYLNHDHQECFNIHDIVIVLFGGE